MSVLRAVANSYQSQLSSGMLFWSLVNVTDAKKDGRLLILLFDTKRVPYKRQHVNSLISRFSTSLDLASNNTDHRPETIRFRDDITRAFFHNQCGLRYKKEFNSALIRVKHNGVDDVDVRDDTEEELINFSARKFLETLVHYNVVILSGFERMRKLECMFRVHPETYQIRARIPNKSVSTALIDIIFGSTTRGPRPEEKGSSSFRQSMPPPAAFVVEFNASRPDTASSGARRRTLFVDVGYEDHYTNPNSFLYNMPRAPVVHSHLSTQLETSVEQIADWFYTEKSQSKE